MLVTYVERCSVCSCASLRDEGCRHPVPGLKGCVAGCPCHDDVPATAVRSARAAAAALSNDAVRYRLFRRDRRSAVRTAAR